MPKTLERVVVRIIDWLSRLSCKSKCCSGSECSCGAKEEEGV